MEWCFSTKISEYWPICWREKTVWIVSPQLYLEYMGIYNPFGKALTIEHTLPSFCKCLEALDLIHTVWQHFSHTNELISRKPESLGNIKGDDKYVGVTWTPLAVSFEWPRKLNNKEA